MIYNPGTPAAGTGTNAIAGAVITECPELELAATNLLLQSADFATTWTTSGAIVITANTTASPRGVVEADTLNDNGGTLGEVQQNVVIPNDALTRVFSVYLSPGTSVQTRVGVRLAGGVAKDANIDIVPASGITLAASADVAASAVEVLSIGGVTWVRVSVAVANNTSGNVTATPYINPASASVAAQGTVIAWGAQLETGSVASSQIPTTTAQVTRTAGVIPSWLLGVTGSSYSVQTFTASGTYTAPAGLVAAIVIVVAGGAGGGTGTSDGATNGAGGGGGGGGSAIKLLQAATIGASQAVTVGAAAAAGAAGNTSSFGALLSATGGTAGGAGNLANGTPGIGGTGSGGDLNISGGDGSRGELSLVIGGHGGDSLFGGNARPGANAAGTAGKAYGGGGGGGATNSVGSQGGGGGAAGVVYVIEFKA